MNTIFLGTQVGITLTWGHGTVVDFAYHISHDSRDFTTWARLAFQA